MGLLDGVAKRFGVNGMSDLNPELVLGLRGIKARTIFVNSGASSGGNGASWDSALTTLVAAQELAVADDVILVAPGHVETIIAAAGLVLGKAGVTYIGLGNGNRRPQINFTTVVGADMDITGAGVRMRNFRFTGGFDALTNPVHLAAADIELLDIITEDVTGQATDFIVGTDACDRLLISGWKHRGAAGAGADTALSVVGADDVIVEDFEVYGNFAVGGIEQVTTAGNRWRIGGGVGQNFIWTEHANDIAITMKSDTTGVIGPNINIMLQDNAANITECVVAAAMQHMLPINVCNLAGEASMAINITASTDA